MAEKSSKLKIKLIITLILFILAIAMMVVGIWASQAGKDRWKADVTISTKDVDLKVSAYVTGATNTTDIGYSASNPKTLIDVTEDDDVVEPADWSDINFTFANKNTAIELVIIVENRKLGGEVNALLEVSLGNYAITDVPTEIGNSNVIAYIVAPSKINGALEGVNQFEEFKVILEIADQNKDVKPTELNISLTLTDANQEL